MVRTFSTMLPLGTRLPSFDLKVVQNSTLLDQDQSGGPGTISNKMLNKKPILLMVICAHCPFVKHIEPQISMLDHDYGDKVQILAVSSNSLITHPQDAPQQLALQVEKRGWRFPYLIDEEQALAKDLKAACTPDFFLFSMQQDNQQRLRYRGQLDSSRPGNRLPVNGSDLRSALDAVLEGKEVSSDQQPSIGCNIKWHPGQEPYWFG